MQSCLVSFPDSRSCIYFPTFAIHIYIPWTPHHFYDACPHARTRKTPQRKVEIITRVRKRRFVYQYLHGYVYRLFSSSHHFVSSMHMTCRTVTYVYVCICMCIPRYPCVCHIILLRRHESLSPCHAYALSSSSSSLVGKTSGSVIKRKERHIRRRRKKERKDG